MQAVHITAKKRRERAKFSGRTHSKRGLISFGVGIVVILSFLMLINYNFILKGEGSEYVGSVGILLSMFAIVGLVLGIKGLREEDVYKMAPALGTLFNSISIIILIAVFVMGMLI